jgi:hypothetical protein
MVNFPFQRWDFTKKQSNIIHLQMTYIPFNVNPGLTNHDLLIRGVLPK